MIGWFLNTKLGRWLMIAGAAFLALVTLRWNWKREGAREERREATEKDSRNAQDIRDRVRDARSDGLPDTPDDFFRD